MKLRHLCFAALAAASMMAATASADQVLTGGNILTAGNWADSVSGATGLPDATDDGLINANGTIGGNFNSGGVTRFVNTTINQTGGTITGIVNSAGATGLMWNMSGGIIDSSGAAGTSNFNSNGGAIFNLTGGEVIFGNDLIVNSSVGGINVGGSAIISTASDFDLRLNQDNAFLEIDPTWTGFFESGSDVTATQWIDQLVFGAGPAGTGTAGTVNSLRQITVGGTAIDDTNFGNFFEVFDDQAGGSSLRLIQTAIPEPSSLAVLGLGVLGLVTRRRRS